MCETVHRFHRHSGKSFMVEKRCARPTECTIESIGCEKLHSKHHRHQMVSTREIVHAVLSSAGVVFFFFYSKSTFSKNSFRNTIGESNSLDQHQSRSFVRSDLGPICSQRL